MLLRLYALILVHDVWRLTDPDSFFGFMSFRLFTVVHLHRHFWVFVLGGGGGWGGGGRGAGGA